MSAAKSSAGCSSHVARRQESGRRPRRGDPRPLKGQHLKAKGKRGELQFTVHDDVEVTRDGDKLNFKPRTESRRARMQWGTARNLASNLVKGVSDGFTINLEINGVGYRAQADAKNLKLQLGFSHDVEVPIPAGIQIKALKPSCSLRFLASAWAR